MAKPKSHYIKYKLAELESYIKNPESCVKKIKYTERLRFAPNIMGDFKESVMRILSRKIGKYDMNMHGVVLDFRNTKVLSCFADVRNDSAYSILNVESNFYLFAPRKDAIVDGIVKHINRQSIETIISVVIYRVFNVKVTFKGCIKGDQVSENDVIKIRIKQFHFDNEIPFVEGEMVGASPATSTNRKLMFDDIPDSGISESSITLEHEGSQSSSKSPVRGRIKQETSTQQTSSSAAPIRQKSSKRQRSKSPEREQPALKRIKQEPPSSGDEHTTPSSRVNIKQEKPDSDDYTNETGAKLKNSKKTRDDEALTIGEQQPEKKKKDKKKKKKNKEPDFLEALESSLQMIVDTTKIKTEKD